MARKTTAEVQTLWQAQFTANPDQGWAARKLDWSIIRNHALGEELPIVSDGLFYKFMQIFGKSDAPAEPTFEYQHDAPVVDVLAGLIEMQVNLAVWARRNGDYSNKLQDLAGAIDTSITAIESAQACLSLEEENQDLANKLQSADAQLKVLQDIIDREREARRKRDSPHIRGD